MEQPPVKGEPPTCFPNHDWPAFIRQMMDCGETPAQRDVLLLGGLTVIGSTLNKLLYTPYGKKMKYPCLQTFIIAPPRFGKGRYIVEPEAGGTFAQHLHGQLPQGDGDLSAGTFAMGMSGQGKGQ